MKLNIVIDGEQLPGYGGEYELDLDDLIHDEWYTIQDISGVRGGELYPSLAAVDVKLMDALAIIALARAGKTLNLEQIKRTRFGSVLMLPVVEEDDEPIPPAQTGTESGGDVNESSTPSGTPTPADSETPAAVQLPIGARGSSGAA